MVKDPVCGMMIDEKTAAATSEYQGRTIYFCAAICKTKFDQDPGRYMDKK
jgi:P-type Cu+ transporter